MGRIVIQSVAVGGLLKTATASSPEIGSIVRDSGARPSCLDHFGIMPLATRDHRFALLSLFNNELSVGHDSIMKLRHR